MKKELLVLLVVAVVSVVGLVYQIQSIGTIGAVVNDIGTVRLERVQEARFDFLGRGIPRPCRDETKRIMALIRENGDGRYYDHTGLINRNLYFTNEKELFAHLVAVTNLGVPEIQGPAAEYMSAANTCPLHIARQAHEKLVRISNIDLELARKTIQNSWCPDKNEAELTYSIANTLYYANNYTGMLDTLESALGALQCQ